MEPLRLLHVFPSFNPGGAELRVVRIMNAIGERARHGVLALNGKYGAREHIDRAVAAVFLEPPPPGRPPAYWSALRALIRAQRPDLLLTYNWGSMDAVTASWLGTGCPLLHNECGFAADEAAGLKRRRVIARRILLRRAYGVAVTAKVMRETVIHRFGVPPEKVFWIRTGVDVERFRPGSGSPWRAAAGVGETDLLFGFVGAFRAEKDLPFLVRAFAGAAIPGAKLALVGDGPCRGELEQLVRELGVSRSVLLPGYAAAPEDVLRAMDVFVMSSSTEAAPNSLLEALASGLPVVATDVGDIRELLGAEAGESVVAAGDLSGYSAALRRRAESAEERKRSGDANRTRVASRHSFAAMVSAYEALYVAAAKNLPAERHLVKKSNGLS
jgi:glycosyltransferase involved in cell wall biosynthesis